MSDEQPVEAIPILAARLLLRETARLLEIAGRSERVTTVLDHLRVSDELLGQLEDDPGCLPEGNP